jgi:hypothetical protein
VQQLVRRVKYSTLGKLLTAKERFPADTTPYLPDDDDAAKVLFPEYLTCEDKSLFVASHLIQWLACENQRESVVAELAKLKARVGHGGASRTAAELILAEVRQRVNTKPPRSHFVSGMSVASSGGAEMPAAPSKPTRQKLPRAA